MFGWGRVSARAKAWGSDQLGKELADYTEEVLYSETGSKLRHFSDDWKQPIVDELRTQIRTEILAMANSIVSCRYLIAAEALALGQLHALTLTEADMADFGYGQARLISFQLHRHIKACYPHVDELNKYLQRFPDSDDSGLVSWANTQGAIRNYRLNAFNKIRFHFGDMVLPKERDWFAPLVASATVWFEDDFRQKLGLPRLTDDPLGVLAISTLSNSVRSGLRDPLAAWEARHGVRFVDCL
jgi:hypothetical protein